MVVTILDREYEIKNHVLENLMHELVSSSSMTSQGRKTLIPSSIISSS